jgi:HSP20 family molecular chaperone IbpA
MAVVWPGPILPSPFLEVDHPHPRWHSHLGSLSAILPSAFSTAHPHPFSPDLDIREDTAAFYIAVELPGLRNPAAVSIVWHNARTMHITGRVDYSFSGEAIDDAAAQIEAEMAGERTMRGPEGVETREPAVHATTATNGTNGKVHEPQKESAVSSSEVLEYGGEPLVRTLRHVLHAKYHREATELFAVHERKTGAFKRSVTFPVEVEMKKLTANLEAGLLKIVVPKIVDEVFEGGRAHVTMSE